MKDLENKIASIYKKVTTLVARTERLSKEKQAVEKENNANKEEIEALKKRNFDLVEKLKVAQMAVQLNVDKGEQDKLKRQIDKYVREVDSVINGLKKME